MQQFELQELPSIFMHCYSAYGTLCPILVNKDYSVNNYCISFFFQSMFFLLLQTEQGDIFKITMEVDEDMVSILCILSIC